MTAPEAEEIAVELLDRGYASIMATMIETGEAPHFTELAADLGLAPAEGRAVVEQLMAVTPGWLHPGTDYIASFPPFNNQPTQYRLSIDGQKGWYGQ